MAEILNPQDAELEEVILGACLIGREAMPMVADRLRPEMFYFDKNALIYAAMQVMYREGRQIDIITVKNELVARGKLDARRASGSNGVTGISTGLADLDRLTSGWQRGDLNVIAARPAVGKTAFALHLARAAATAGNHVAVYSLEMQGERLGDRWLIAASPDVNARHLRSGQLTDDEVAQVRTAASELRVLPIHVDDHPVTSMDRVRSSARMLQSKGKCDLIILDYLQLCDMKSDQKNRNREQEVAQTTRKAKLMAKELNVPVLLLSQLNRGSDGRPFSRPILSDLRESGAIEQDADMVMLLYRPALAGIRTEPVSKYPSEHLGVVIVAKHRNGETGDVYFAHNPSMTKLGEYVPPTEWLMRNAK